MKKILVFVFFFVMGSMGAFAQEKNDSSKKIVADTASSYSRLDAGQIYELERLKIDALIDKSWDQKAELYAPIAGFVTAIVMLLIFTFFTYKVKQRRYEVFLKYAELGKDIPKEFLEGNLGRKANSKLAKGILNVCIGSGIITWLTTTPSLFEVGKLAAGAGFIFLFIGIAYLIIHFIEKKQPQSDEPGR